MASMYLPAVRHYLATPLSVLNGTQGWWIGVDYLYLYLYPIRVRQWLLTGGGEVLCYSEMRLATIRRPRYVRCIQIGKELDLDIRHITLVKLGVWWNMTNVRGNRHHIDIDLGLQFAGEILWATATINSFLHTVILTHNSLTFTNSEILPTKPKPNFKGWSTIKGWIWVLGFGEKS